ncbi:MAG: hypothetical protein M1818_002985 [Claussenomyces sp. TS43310]|nr:MAG: hypothetical protein M1818_002985 [Claussenomyces sp. TS43310]
MSQNHVFCIIVGGGMSGVTMGVHLIRDKVLEYDELKIFDKSADYGGVWEANKYPGAACDTPSHVYQMRYRLKPDWSRVYAPRAEIQGYYADIAREHGLQRSTSFNTKVIETRWNESTLLWHVLAENVLTGKQVWWTANTVVSAGGQFSRPKYAKIPGREEFKGTQWHTAEWNHDFDLSGKRVAIIGTGPSTAQVAPKIQPLVKELTIYQRSPTYVIPRNDRRFESWIVGIFSWVPFALWFYHVWFYYTVEKSKPTWLRGTKEHDMAQAAAVAHLERQIKDPELREKLKPTHDFGCKRVLVLDDWYPIFNQPNVNLITDVPVRISEHGIVSKPVTAVSQELRKTEPAGAYDVHNKSSQAHETEKEIDVLIWGTGFNMMDQGGNFQAYGVDGVNLSQLWGDKPSAYYAVAVNKFPNFLLIFGPNSANFWSNVTTLIQIQARYNAKVIKHLKQKSRKGPYAVNVKQKVQENYNDYIQNNMGDIAIKSPNCSNYYTNARGEITFWNPLNGWNYGWRLLWPNWQDYDEIKPRRSEKVGNGHVTHEEYSFVQKS